MCERRLHGNVMRSVGAKNASIGLNPALKFKLIFEIGAGTHESTGGIKIPSKLRVCAVQILLLNIARCAVRFSLYDA